QRSQLGDGNGRSIGSQVDFRTADSVEVAEDFGFDFKLFGCGFHHQVTVCQLCPVHYRLNTLQRRSLVVRGDLGLNQLPLKVLVNGLESAVQEALCHVAQHDLIPAAGKDMGNAVAHGSGTDDSHAVDLHDDFSSLTKDGKV